MNINNVPDVRHPFCNYTLADAVRLATVQANIVGNDAPTTLEEARECIQSMADRVDHVWITGAVALDVLDAAIQGAAFNIETLRFP